MGSTKQSSRTASTRSGARLGQQQLSRLYEGRISDLRRLVTTLEDQLTAANMLNGSLVAQLAEAQSQIRMAMEDSYFHPQVSRTVNPSANKLAEPDQADDVSQFDGEADGQVLAGEAQGDLNAELEKIANEVAERHPELAGAMDGFAKEHQ